MASDRKTKNGQHSQAGQDLAEKQGLPCAPDAESYMLAFLLKEGELSQVTDFITVDDLHTEANRRILTCILEVADAGEKTSHVMVADALRRRGWLESVGGLTALVSLDRDMPDISGIDGWVRKIKDKSGLRKLIFNAQQTLDRAMHEVGTAEEIAEWASESIAEVQAVQGDRQEHGSSPENIIERFPGGISAFLDPSRRVRGLPTGFEKLDEMTNGMNPGELIIIAARPAVGKSAFALNILSHLCLHPRQRRMVAFFSLEMTAASLMTRLMCANARVDSNKFRAGYLNSDERRKLQVALDDILNSNMRIFDKFGITLPEIHKHTKAMVKDEGCQAIIIDYAQLIGIKGRFENRNLEIGYMTRELKLLSGECNIPVILLSQLSRAADKRPTGQQKPQLSDLRDGGSLESDASAVWFLFRQEMVTPDREDCRGLAELIVAKNREGPSGTCQLRYLNSYTKFEAMTHYPEEQQSGLNLND